jgi:hypothetical protein
MHKFDNFTKTLPGDVPCKPGVYAIARNINERVDTFEILYCAESENINTDAEQTMYKMEFEGFLNSIFYFIHLESDPTRRKILLNELNCNRKLK